MKAWRCAMVSGWGATFLWSPGAARVMCFGDHSQGYTCFYVFKVPDVQARGGTRQLCLSLTNTAPEVRRRHPPPPRTHNKRKKKKQQEFTSCGGHLFWCFSTYQCI